MNHEREFRGGGIETQPGDRLDIQNKRRAFNLSCRKGAIWSPWVGIVVFFTFQTLFAAFGSIKGFDLGDVSGMPQLADMGMFSSDLLLSLGFALGAILLTFLAIVASCYAYYRNNEDADELDVDAQREERDMTVLERKFPEALPLAFWLAIIAGAVTIAVLGGFGATAEVAPALASLGRMSSAGVFSGELITAGIVMAATFVAVLVISLIALAIKQGVDHNTREGNVRARFDALDGDDERNRRTVSSEDDCGCFDGLKKVFSSNSEPRNADRYDDIPPARGPAYTGH